MNDLIQKISNAITESGLLDRLTLHDTETVIAILDTDGKTTLYSNTKLDKPFDIDRVDTLIKTGNPAIHIERIRIDDKNTSCMTIYFPVKNNNEITAFGIIGIPFTGSARTKIKSGLSVNDAKEDIHTGMKNSSFIMKSLQKEIITPEHPPPTIVLINIDKFAKMNEEWGQLTMNATLVEFCELIKNHLRSSDLFGQWGKKEFILLLPETGLVTGKQIAERIMIAIEHQTFSKIGHITASFGVATYEPGETIEDFINRINAAVFTAKVSGKNRVELKAGPFLKLVWKHEYECSNPVIDEQHRKLFSHSNELLQAIFKNKPKKQISSLIDQLLTHIQKHFDEEEQILASMGYMLTEEHALIHRELIEKASLLAVRFEKNELDFDEIFSFLAQDVVIEHMQIEDRKFFPFLSEIHV